MNYAKIEKIASDLEKELEIEDIEKRVQEEKENTDVPEPVLEASDEDVMAYLQAQEESVDNNADEVEANDEDLVVSEEQEEEMTDDEKEKCLATAEKLVAIAKKLKAKKNDLTASQEKELVAKIRSVVAAGMGDDEDDAPTKQEVVQNVQRKFSKHGPLLTKIKWKETKWTPNTKLREMTLDDLRELLTHIM